MLVAEATALAYSRLGFLGAILAGLLILFTAVQSEFQKDGICRPFVAEGLSRMERMAREAEGEGMAQFWRLAKIVRATLTAIGLAGFAYLQLPP